MTKDPYNKGDAYENYVFNIMNEKRLIPSGVKRAGAGGGTDIPFIHHGKIFNLEVKKDLQADFGQKYFKWDKSNGWSWAVDDEVTRLYTNLGVLKILKNRSIIPIKHNKPDTQITFKDKRADQKAFKNMIDISVETLYKYYEIKNCFYIQIGKGFGFYHLKEDIANLGTQKFNTTVKLRFRAKTIHSEPVWKYDFLVALKIQLSKKKQKVKLQPSKFNIDNTHDQEFPPIMP